MALPTSGPQGGLPRPDKGLPLPPKKESALPLPEMKKETRLPSPAPAAAPEQQAPPRREAPPTRETMPAAPKKNPLDAIDFVNTPLNQINLAEYGVAMSSLPIFQEAVGKPTAKNYVRELRLVKDDKNARGPIVVDPRTGRLFRQLPKSEFAGDDPLLTVDDFNTDDLNAEAAAMLGHLQVTSNSEARDIALRRKGVSKA